jgi:hypothetical protein
MIVGFARINGEVKNCEMSQATHNQIRSWCFKSKEKMGDFVKAAWGKYGVSEGALLRLLEEKTNIKY